MAGELLFRIITRPLVVGISFRRSRLGLRSESGPSLLPLPQAHEHRNTDKSQNHNHDPNRDSGDGSSRQPRLSGCRFITGVGIAAVQWKDGVTDPKRGPAGNVGDGDLPPGAVQSAFFSAGRRNIVDPDLGRRAQEAHTVAVGRLALGHREAGPPARRAAPRLDEGLAASHGQGLGTISRPAADAGRPWVRQARQMHYVERCSVRTATGVSAHRSSFSPNLVPRGLHISS